MSAKPEVLKVVRQGANEIENDLKNPEHILTLKDDCPLDTVCFHAQQYAGKYLNAFLTFQRIDFPKSHDLSELIALLPDKEWLPFSVNEYEQPTDYATVTRYPGHWETIERRDAEQAVTLAKQMRDAIRKILPSEALNGKGGKGAQ